MPNKIKLQRPVVERGNGTTKPETVYSANNPSQKTERNRANESRGTKILKSRELRGRDRDSKRDRVPDEAYMIKGLGRKRWVLEGLIINPKDSRKEQQKEIMSEVAEKEGPIRKISSNQAEFLMPRRHKDERGTFKSLVKIRGAQERPKTRATKQ